MLEAKGQGMQLDTDSAVELVRGTGVGRTKAPGGESGRERTCGFCSKADGGPVAGQRRAARAQATTRGENVRALPDAAAPLRMFRSQ